MVGEVEGRVGAEQTRELGVLRPTRYERGPVAAQAAYLVLSRRRSDHDSTGRRVAVELDPLGQRTAGARIRARTERSDSRARIRNRMAQARASPLRSCRARGRAAQASHGCRARAGTTVRWTRRSNRGLQT